MFQYKYTEEPAPLHGDAISIDVFEKLAERSPDMRYEYIDGRIYAMSGGTANHNRLTGKMYSLLEEQFASGPCHAFFDMYVCLADDSRVLPDVVVTCDVADYHNGSTLIRSPHIVVEVLSNSTTRIDRNEKFLAYTRVPSIEAYMLIHQYKVQVEVYRRAEDWKATIYGPGEELMLTSLDITFPVDELYKVLL